MEVLSILYHIHYSACVVSLIYIFNTRVDLYFSVNKLAKFSSNSGKLSFEGLVQFLRYIRYNKNLGLIYYANIEDATLSDLLI